MRSEDPADLAEPAEAEPDDGFPKISGKHVLQATAGLTFAVVLIAVGLPFFAHTGWDQIGKHLGLLGWGASFELIGLLIVGLWLYTFTLTGSLPGLRHTRALILNVCGSSVSNVLPGGGAVGLAATYLLARTWGFSKRSISTSIIVTGVWNVLARVALPLLGFAALSTSDNALPKSVRSGAFWGGVLGLVVLGAFIAVLVSHRWTDLLGRWLDRFCGGAVARLRRGANKGRRVDLHGLLLDQRSRLSVVTRTGWFPMTVGVVGYLAVYFILFWRAMDAVGVVLPLTNLFAAYAVGRLLTAVGVTPGGLGVTEAGTLAVLVAWGADKPAAAAGVLVFALFTHVAEIPLGAIGWLAWWTGPKSLPTPSLVPTPRGH
ncbi:lysylphosphatidylglycerol synthase transmembrane domain-containing protein [Leekyejoonella antrihumi]|uniref:Flippase-like domain-containing protein n=1 Tax=Leekyejoonella antrihumi TaxID=1660198 RepID=A0A563E0D4_9MICO|nr:lysylphosphatidylglycerol synthase transmembrane domain-containing protein [Leekyejoonella antrihumi]TWP35976.1 flippase-like domain-containing protein [Leekyejoonella antrihumi]